MAVVRLIVLFVARLLARVGLEASSLSSMPRMLESGLGTVDCDVVFVT
jgi:hypothetical protein